MQRERSGLIMSNLSQKIKQCRSTEEIIILFNYDGELIRTVVHRLLEPCFPSRLPDSVSEKDIEREDSGKILQDFWTWTSALQICLGSRLHHCRERLNSLDPLFPAYALAVLEMLPSETGFIELKIEFAERQCALLDQLKIPFGDLWSVRTLMTLSSARIAKVKYGDNESVSKALSYLQEIEKRPIIQNYVLDRAVLCNLLGMAYRNSSSGLRRENLETATDYFKQGLRLVSATNAPYRHARLCLNAGSTPLDAAPFKGAGETAEALELLKGAEAFFTHHEFPYEYGLLHLNLGLAHKLLLESDPAEHHRLAVNHFNESLTVFTPYKHRREWLGALINLSNLYAAREKGESAGNLEKALSILEQSLPFLSKNEHPVEHLKILLNLGAFYGRRIEGEASENVKKSIGFFREALESELLETDRERRARLNVNLGLAYLIDVTGDKSANLEKSLECFSEALNVIERSDNELFWGRIQLNLSKIFYDRIRGKKSDNLERSIQHAYCALDVFKKKKQPVLLTLTLSNLASAFLERGIGDPKMNRNFALDKLAEATKIAPRSKFPSLWATVNQLSGIAHRDMPSDHPEKHLQKAERYFNQALEINTQANNPIAWAQLNLEKAESLLKKYRLNEKQVLRPLIECCTNALSGFTLESFPEERRATFAILGDAYSLISRWKCAFDAYSSAIDSHKWKEKQAVLRPTIAHGLEKAAALYSKASFCLAKMGEPAASVQWLEQGKTCLLGNVLRKSKALYEDIPLQDKKVFERLAAKLKTLESEMKGLFSRQRRYSDMAQEAGSLKEKWEQHVRRIQSFMPDFLQNRIIDPEKTAEKMSPSDALIVFNVAEAETVIILMLCKENKATVKTFFQPNFNMTDLKNAARLWSVFSFNPSTSSEERNRPPEILNKLYNALIEPVLDDLVKNNVKRLLLNPHHLLGALPLHLMYTKNRNGEPLYLLDRYELNIVPGMNLSGSASPVMKGKAGVSGRKILLVGNPTGDLPWADKETEAVKKIAENSTVMLKGEKASIKELIRHAPESAVIHFACHGRFTDKDPFQAFLLLAAAPDHKSDSGRQSESHTSAVDAAEKLGRLSRNDPRLNVAVIPDYAGERLTLEDILREMKIPGAELVVISSCDSGLAERLNLPDEFLGLSAGFLAVGAAAVISALWKVNDRSTSILMRFFYQNLLHKKMAPGKALRKAQLTLKQQKGYSSPYHWGAFFISGF